MENLELKLDRPPYKTSVCLLGTPEFRYDPCIRLDAETARSDGSGWPWPWWKFIQNYGGRGGRWPIVETYDRPPAINKGAGTGRRPFIRLDAETAKSDGSGWPWPFPWKFIQNHGGNGGLWPIVETYIPPI